jgi:predicted O-methyltransferase YrrM
VELERVTEAVKGIPWMSPTQGKIVYEHIRETRPQLVLELGTAHGVSAAYMAAALQENGEGRIETVDRAGSGFEPKPLLDSLGLGDWVDVVVREDSSYTWYLKEQIAANSDAAGNCTPIYDFCYLDGAKSWTIDGLAALLVEKLLRPDGWLLLDDLEWSYDSSPSGAAEPFPLSKAERSEPNIRAVFDLLVRQHPNFAEFVVQDGNWAWARKAPGAPRTYAVTASRSFTGMAASGVWELGRWVSARRPRRS